MAQKLLQFVVYLLLLYDISNAEWDIYKKKINSSSELFKEVEEISEYLHCRQRKEKRERGSAKNSSPGKKQTLKKAEEEWQVILDNFKISLKVM